MPKQYSHGRAREMTLDAASVGTWHDAPHRVDVMTRDRSFQRGALRVNAHVVRGELSHTTNRKTHRSGFQLPNGTPTDAGSVGHDRVVVRFA